MVAVGSPRADGEGGWRLGRGVVEREILRFGFPEHCSFNVDIVYISWKIGKRM